MELADVSMRDAVGRLLCELGDELGDLVIVTADVGKATRAYLFGIKFPGRYFNVGISEQHLIDFAAGIAVAGGRPIAIAFAMFLMRAWEQIRNAVGRMNLNVKIIGTHAGFSDHADGSSHQSLEDIALMRTIPNMSVVVPSDVADIYRSLPIIVKDIKGPLYYRIGRDYSPRITNDYDYEFKLGKAYVLEDGYDVAIVSSGPILYEVLNAAKELRKLGVNAAIINLMSIKPIDEVTLEIYARKCGYVVTVEEHSIYGGLGSAVAEVLVTKYPVPMKLLGTSTYGRSAKNVRDLLNYYGLTAPAVAKSVIELLTMYRR